VFCNGWASWSPSAEYVVRGGRVVDANGRRAKQPGPRRTLSVLNRLIYRPGEKHLRGTLTGHFIMTLRHGEDYLCFASLGESRGILPPVTFTASLKTGTVAAHIYCPGKVFHSGEAMAEIAVFHAQGVFALKDALRALYQADEVFAPNSALGEQRIAGYESWYNHYTNIDEATIRADLAGFTTGVNIITKHFAAQPLVFQIDDGWEDAVGDWRVNKERFPNGLEPLASSIADAGLVPGLWLAPFIAVQGSRLYREHYDWILKDKKGKPVSAGLSFNWGKGFNFYALDLTQDAVIDYAAGVIGRAIEDWGFRYIKLDFLYAGFLSGGDYYARALERITALKTNSKGLPIVYLGCGAPLGPSQRFLPLCRIGEDTKEAWDDPFLKTLGFPGRPGAYLNLKATLERSLLNGSVFQNDPDVIFLRSQNCKLTDNEKELIAVVDYLFGSQVMFSDNCAAYTEADRALSARCEELWQKFDASGNKAGDYAAVPQGNDVYQIISRNGKITGTIDLKKRTHTETQSH
jgi:alpha-galactosidase